LKKRYLRKGEGPKKRRKKTFKQLKLILFEVIRMSSLGNIMGAFLMFILVLLSHGTLKATLNSYANNATITNSIIRFINDIFNYLWGFFAIILLSICLYIAVAEIRK